MNFYVVWRFFGWFSRGFMRFHETSCFVCVFWRCLMCFNVFFSRIFMNPHEISCVFARFFVISSWNFKFVDASCSIFHDLSCFSMLCQHFQEFACFVTFFSSEILKKFQFHEFQRICMLFMFYSCSLQRECWQKPNGGIAFYSQNPCRNLRGA